MKAPLLRTSVDGDDEFDKQGRCKALALATRWVFVAVGCFSLGVLMGSPSRQKVGNFLKATPPGTHTPFYRIVAATSYEAGLQHGRLAKKQIHGWFATAEMQTAFGFVENDGRHLFEELKVANTKEFPSYVEEMQGIADGAGVTVDQVWCANMLNELESLMKTRNGRGPSKHCSDIFAISPDGYSKGFALGHNDDWSSFVKPFWYVMAITYNSTVEQERLGFKHCAGNAYPAGLIGWSPTWNAYGIFATQNSLTPRKSRASGLATTFVQRRATCSARSLDDAVKGYSVPGWADSASMNVIDIRNKRMANVEIWEDSHSVIEVTESMKNYSHFNEFKHLWTRSGNAIDNPSTFLDDVRQRRVDSLPAPRSTVDLAARLSDFDIYKPDDTINTIVVNGTTGELTMWCGVPSINHPPSYSWNLLNSFEP